MTVGVPLPQARGRRLRLRDAAWWRETWAAVLHLLAGALLWLVPTAVALILFSLVAAKGGPLRRTGLDKDVQVVIALSLLGIELLALYALTPRFTAWQRTRFRAALGVRLAPFAPYRPDLSGWRRTAGALLTRRTRRQARYHALAGLLTTAATAAFVVCVLAGTTGVIMPIARHRHAARTIPWLVIGVLLIYLAPWLVRGAAALDVALARALLQPSGDEALALRVESLSASRAGVVDAADAERRRIERNLHDGTQQRLVSLAMNLGLTRTAVRDADPAIRDAVAAAHEEAKQALVELRDFIRGLHPAILDEQGLDAALSGIAARSPVPVRLGVDLPQRPARAIEAVAYFVVSEALTNAARHAHASLVDIAVRQHPGQVAVSVTDDGCGGADEARGTGLRGLRQRVESVDGTWLIVSPVGGPTTIIVTLPYAPLDPRDAAEPCG